MTPKIIHYCWFGLGEKPVSFEKYIESWKEILPDYEIVEWNESNFDISSCSYVTEAYEAKKYAFVSDYVRLWALFKYGGIYLDTDVLMLKDLSDFLLDEQLILGFEEKNWVCTSTIISPKGNRFIKKFMNSYHRRSFVKEDGTFDMTTNVDTLTGLLLEIGLEQNGYKQTLAYLDEKITVLPQEFFSPYDYINNIDKRTSESLTMHCFDVSWASPTMKVKKYIRKIVNMIRVW